MKKLAIVIMTVLFIFSTLNPAFAYSDSSENYQAQSITFDKNELTLEGTGESYKLDVVTNPVDYDRELITWNSTDKSVASVDSNGIIVSCGVGSTTVFAMTANGKVAECKVNVKEVGIENVNIIGSKSLYLGSSDYYFIKYTPSNTTQRYITLSSSNEEIVSYPKSVNSCNSFKLAAKNVGTTTITATLENGMKTSFDVTVKPIYATSLNLAYSSLNITVGEEKVINSEVLPKNTTDKTLTWNSTDNEVVKVDQNGKIEALKEGSAVVSAKTVNGIEKEVNINVEPIKGEKISIDRDVLTLDVEQTSLLNASVYPENAKNKNIYWQSEDENIATVDNNGNVTGKNTGKTKVKAILEENNDIYGVCEIVVNPIKVESVELNKTEIQANEGEIVYLQSYVYPLNAYDKSVKWISSNDKIAKVDQTGKVTMLNEGITTIKAETENGQKAYCNVVVKGKENKVTSSVKQPLSVGKISKLSLKTTKRTATITISKAKNAKTYEIYRSTKKSSGFKKVATVKTKK